MTQFTPHMIQHIGFRAEATKGTDPIDADNGPYFFGLEDMSHGPYPEITHQIRQARTGESRNPQKLNAVGTQVSSTLTFTPVNGLMAYYALGSSSTAAGVHTITRIDSGELPTFTTRWETGVATDGEMLKRSILGCKVNQLQYVGNMTSPDALLMMQFNLLSKQGATPTYTTTVLTPTHPDDESSPYRRDSNFSFLWDGEEMGDELLNFTVGVSDTMRFDRIVNKVYPDEILEGEYEFPFTLTVARGHTGSSLTSHLYEDYLAQVGTGTTSSDAFKDATIKVYNGTSNYIQFALTEAAMSSLAMNHVGPSSLEMPTYSIRGVARNLVVTCKDGVAASFYGE